MTTVFNAVWLMDGLTLVESPFINGVADVNWKIRAVDNLDRDGKNDTFRQHQVTGT